MQILLGRNNKWVLSSSVLVPANNPSLQVDLIKGQKGNQRNTRAGTEGRKSILCLFQRRLPGSLFPLPRPSLMIIVRVLSTCQKSHPSSTPATALGSHSPSQTTNLSLSISVALSSLCKIFLKKHIACLIEQKTFLSQISSFMEYHSQ